MSERNIRIKSVEELQVLEVEVEIPFAALVFLYFVLYSYFNFL